MVVDFQTDPSKYRHWRIELSGEVAHLVMDVDETGGLMEGYELKLNSYDLGVDIELYDAVQRLRFEHPEVKVVVLKSGNEKVFCAGANIRMLAGAAHAHKVNFCKFTNETRNSIESATAQSGQKYISAVTGACAGGGYELALATDHIILVDDGASAVALPEVPLLAVLPGTGGLTRLTDKRKVRRDHADVFCSTEEGVKGRRAVDWRLVDEVATKTRFDELVAQRAGEFARQSDRPDVAEGVRLGALERNIGDATVTYSTVRVEIDRKARSACVTVLGPRDAVPADAAAALAQGDQFWPLRAARELDDALLHLRLNEMEIGVLQIRTEGDCDAVLDHDRLLKREEGNWFAREVTLYWERVLKRLDLTSRSLVALIEGGSCFAGTLAELAFACDRSYMALGEFEGSNLPPALLGLGDANFGSYPMSNGLTRLETRFLGEPESVTTAEGLRGQLIEADLAEDHGLVTFAVDDIDWEDEIRIFMEERASFSPDGLTGMEANLRFGGPETMESKIFGRLTAWQNWIFQRGNAVGSDGALQRYGTGQTPEFNLQRV